MKKSLFYIFFLINYTLFAQNATLFKVDAYVKDEDGKAVPRANVFIGYNSLKFACDDNGYFQTFLVKDTHPFEISAVGFLTDRRAVTITKDTVLTLTLKQVANQLEQVIISGDRGAENIRKPVGVAQLNTKVLKKIPAAFGETDLLRGLQMLPGVSTVGEASNGINVRGGSTDQNLMLLDDTPIFNPTHMFGLFSIFPPDGVSRAELYKGNVPSRFGGRASSVLDVVLSNPTMDSIRASIGVGLVSSRFMVDVPLIEDKLGVILTGRGCFTDFLLPIVSKKNFENTRANFQEGSLKAIFRPNAKNNFSFSGYYSNDFFQTNLLGTIANINASLTQNTYSTANFNLKYFHSFNNRLSISNSLSYVDYNPSLLLPEKGVDNTVELRSGVAFRQFRSNLDFRHDRHEAKIGVNVAYYKINPGELIPNASPTINPVQTNQEYSLETAIFAEDNFKILPNLATSIGLRYSYFMNLGPSVVRQYAVGLPFIEANVIGQKEYAENAIIKPYGGLEPRLALRYDLSKNTSLKVAYNLMRQYIQTVTNTTTPLPTSRWKTSDEYILPQVSHAYSAGWFHNLEENIYELSAELYYRKTNNIIEYKPGANFILKQFPETELLNGLNRSYGVELMASKKRGDWTGWLSYTYARSENQVNAINDGVWFPSNFDRPHTLNFFSSLGYNKNHTFSFTFVLSSGRPYSSPQGSFIFQGVHYPYYPARNNDRLPIYHRLDFSWNILTTLKEERKWKSYWTFSVYNLYGAGNPYSIYYNNQNGVLKNYALKVFASPIPSLSYNLTFR